MTDLVTGDTGSKLVISCKDSSTQAIDLTGSTVRLIWEGEDGTLKTPTMDIVDAALGVVSYQFAAGEIFAPKMVFEVEVTDSAGQIVTCVDKFQLIVREQLG